MGFNKYERAPFYSTLLHLRSTNAAFKETAKFERLKVNAPNQVMAYSRKNGNDLVVVVLNLSANEIAVTLDANLPKGKNYQEVFTNQISKDIHNLQMPAWGYKVFVYGKK
jgi:glycosidase